MTLTIIQGLIFISYIVFIWIKFKHPLKSISDSWYDLGSPLNILFTLFCFSIGCLMFAHTTGMTPFYFLSGAGLCFTGAAAMFKSNDKMTRMFHIVGAISCVIFGLLAIGIELGSWIPTIVFFISAIILKLLKIKNEIWWIEIAAFIAIFIGLLLFI